MKQTIEIRWHGRGGQGAKTAALLLADVAFHTGKHVQGFPEYGPERMGAPITAYNRISSETIKLHSNIYDPDVVVVIDESIAETGNVLKGLKADGTVVFNSARSVEEVRSALGGYRGTLFVLDARAISEAALGKNIPNTPMLAAVVKATGLMKEDEFLAFMKESLGHKFATKPQVIAGNMKALERAVKEVRKA